MQKKNKNLWLILSIAVLNASGLTIVIPLFPFLLGQYLHTDKIALYLGILISTYAACKFFAAPIMGALSDYFGRKPILLLSLIGTAAGYIILGIGGALWVLFLGRIIDGLAAGDISTLYAYVADNTQGKERTKFYGYLGAANGIGFMLGPAIGGLLGTKHIALPFYLAGCISIITALLINFYLPETLAKSQRSKHFTLKSFNTFAHFKNILILKEARKVLVVGTCFFIGLIFYQSNISVFLKDAFAFGPAYIGALFAVIGVCDIASRAILLPRLLAFSESNIGQVGLFLVIVGFGCIVLGSHYGMILLLWIAIIFITIGEGLFDPPYNNVLSQSVNESNQGQLQGVNQSLHSLYEIFGPFIAGVIYTRNPVVVYIAAALLVFITFINFSGIRTPGKA